MSLSMYQASVPVLIRTLTNLIVVLEKGEAHAQVKGIEQSVLINSRLYPDMFTLTKQVQIATDNAKGCAARLAGIEVPKYEDNEASFADLVKRVQNTIAFLETFTPAQIDGSEQRPVTLPMRSGSLHFEGQPYLLHFVLPNLYFHVVTAYDILRHCGVELGKMDFLGNPDTMGKQ
ncbi:MAG: DUF1993 domain-containing protein [Burkholderiaceae bacterium]|nr:DUF1993 domain-containing protein [Burkholderiaceae bacterium]